MKISDKHYLVVKDGKLYCNKCNCFHEHSDISHDIKIGTKGHKLIEAIPMRHLIYVAWLCKCNKIVVDEQQ